MKPRKMSWSSMMALLAALTGSIQMAAQVAGGGTINFVPRWTNSTTLGNSNISVAGGTVSVIGKNGTNDINLGNAPTALKVSGGFGAFYNSGIGQQGAGGPIQMIAGTGAPAFAAKGGMGGIILVTGGQGANCRPASSRCAAINGEGGSITLQPGAGGIGTFSTGRAGKLLLAPTGGNVGIGETDPIHTLQIKTGGTTLADAWTTRSSRRLKTNIQPLRGALDKIARLQGVSYERKSDGKHEIGVVAEDVNRIVPEIVSHAPETHEVDGVDYSRLAALLIEAVKAQQAEIEQMKRRIEQLASGGSGR